VSSIILRKIPNILRTKLIMISLMANEPSTKFSEFVRNTRIGKGLTTTDVQDRSRQGGAKGISESYVSQIENDYIRNVSIEKMKALAKGLGLSDEEVFSAAKGVLPRVALIINDRLNFLAEIVAAFSPDQLNEFAPLLDVMVREGQRIAITAQTHSVPNDIPYLGGIAEAEAEAAKKEERQTGT
jgi:transcriptional regulator with XRE-family HTH domain